MTKRPQVIEYVKNKYGMENCAKPGTTLASAMEDSPDFRNAVNADPSAKQIMKYAPMLEGLTKSCGVHAAGIVMGEMPLIDLVPLSRDKEGMRPWCRRLWTTSRKAPGRS